MDYVKIPLETLNKTVAVLSQLPWKDINGIMAEIQDSVEVITESTEAIEEAPSHKEDQE